MKLINLSSYSYQVLIALSLNMSKRLNLKILIIILKKEYKAQFQIQKFPSEAKSRISSQCLSLQYFHINIC